MNQLEIQLTVKQALSEDLGGQPPSEGDITANLIPIEQQAIARVITREDAVLCGRAWASEAFLQVDNTLELTWLAEDGDNIKPDECFLEIRGNARAILTAERTALNFLQTLSATATITAECVAILAGGKAKLLDTRKTIPGLRNAQKYAVTCGGGVNHRIGLYDGILIKENHIAAAGGVVQALKQAQLVAPEGVFIQIEVESITQLEMALDAGAAMVLLDNFTVDQLNKAVAISRKYGQKIGRKIILEASGNIGLDKVRRIAETGVDRISIGGLTKNIQAVDLSMRFV